MGVRLGGDQIDQGIVKLWHVHQLGPWPFQRGAELGHKVAHPRLAPRHAVGFKQAHLAPAQAKAHADGIVDLRRCGDTVHQHPQRLTPDGLKEAVADKGVDFLFQDQGEHPDVLHDLHGFGDHFGRVLGAARHFGERQQIDRIERVGHDDVVRRRRALLQVRRLEARRGRADQHARIGLLQLGIDLFL